LKTKWNTLALPVRCALNAKGMTEARWDRLPLIRRQVLLYEAFDELFVATSGAQAFPQPSRH
jgi:hypothetical protein